MATQYSLNMQLSLDNDFQRRVENAICQAAVAIFGESTSNRTTLATKVLQNPTGYAIQFSPGVLSQPTVQASFTNGVVMTTALDSDIQNVVNSLWSAYAGK